MAARTQESASRIASLDLTIDQSHSLKNLSLYHRFVYCSLKSMDNLVRDRIRIASRYHVDSGLGLLASRLAGLLTSALLQSDDVSPTELSGLSRFVSDSRILQSRFADDLMEAFCFRVRESAEGCRTREQAAVIAKKVLKVYRILPLDSDVSLENSCQIELLMETLMLCCRFDVTDSLLVCDLLDVAANKCPAFAPGPSRRSRTGHDDLACLEYLFGHVRRAGRHAPSCRWRAESDGAAPFRDMFSVSRAIARGDVERTSLLLRHGFGADELSEEGSEGYLLRLSIFHLNSKRNPYLVLLREMTLLALQLPNFNLTGKKSCLLLLWNTLPDPCVDFSKLVSIIERVANHASVNYLELADRMRVVSQHFAGYDHVFKSAFGNPRPRSLKHLSRCAIRSRLAERRQLPEGIRRLEQVGILPKILANYVDLLS